MKYLFLFFTLSIFSASNTAYSDTINRERLNNIESFKKAIVGNRLESLLGTSFSTGFKDGEVCTTPFPISSTEVDPHRSLIVHDQATLSSSGVDFSLKKTLENIATQVSPTVPGTTFDGIFKQMWDTQNVSTDPSAIAGNTHCDDNSGSINNFPVTNCPRLEGQEATSPIANIDSYNPIALVNRIDLSHKGWKNCGEHRIIYGKSGGGVSKNLMIFEAVLPNPKPGCRSGCRDVIEFWSHLSNDSDPNSRASKLENFFYNGLPNFSPIVHVNHYSSSATAAMYGGSDSGQIRTNQFLQFPWQLKEFKTLTSCAGGGCEFDILPVSVKSNPYGELWSKDVAVDGGVFASRAESFQTKTLAQVTYDLLGNPSLNSFSYAVDPDKNAADSTAHQTQLDKYRDQMNGSTNTGFQNSLTVAGASLTDPVGLAIPLSADQLANRAVALSCAGCHMPNTFGLTAPNSIGPNVSWPDSLGFVHVDIHTISSGGSSTFNPVNFNGNTNRFPISPALIDEFLPARTSNLVTEYNKDICNCEPSFLSAASLNLSKKSTLEFEKKNLLDLALKSLMNPDTFRVAKEEIKKLESIVAVKNNLTKEDLANNLKQRREIIRKVEASLNNNPQFKAFSLVGAALPKFIEKVSLTSDQVRSLKLKDKASFKRALINELVEKFPQRETVTGSFRTH